MATESLIDWDDPDRNSRILDWRHRARDFGLLPVADGDSTTEETAEVDVRQTPEQLLHDEEPEAFADQSLDDEEDDAPDAGDAVEKPTTEADADLVRT